MSVATGAGRPGSEAEGTELEFGEVESWNALCFGQASHLNMSRQRSVLDNRTDTASPRNKKIIGNRSFENLLGQ